MVNNPPGPSNNERLEALSQTASHLVIEINALNAGTGRTILGFNTQIRRNRRALWIVIGSLVLDVVVTIVLAFTVAHTQNNARQLNQITDRLDYSAKIQRKQVLCPLYKAFVDSKSEAGRKAYPKGPKEYDRLFGIFEGSYQALRCNSTDLKPLPDVDQQK